MQPFLKSTLKSIKLIPTALELEKGILRRTPSLKALEKDGIIRGEGWTLRPTEDGEWYDAREFYAALGVGGGNRVLQLIADGGKVFAELLPLRSPPRGKGSETLEEKEDNSWGGWGKEEARPPSKRVRIGTGEEISKPSFPSFRQREKVEEEKPLGVREKRLKEKKVEGNSPFREEEEWGGPRGGVSSLLPPPSPPSPFPPSPPPSSPSSPPPSSPSTWYSTTFSDSTSSWGSGIEEREAGSSPRPSASYGRRRPEAPRGQPSLFPSPLEDSPLPSGSSIPPSPLEFSTLEGASTSWEFPLRERSPSSSSPLSSPSSSTPFSPSTSSSTSTSSTPSTLSSTSTLSTSAQVKVEEGVEEGVVRILRRGSSGGRAPLEEELRDIWERLWRFLGDEEFHPEGGVNGILEGWGYSPKEVWRAFFRRRWVKETGGGFLRLLR